MLYVMNVSESHRKLQGSSPKKVAQRIADCLREGCIRTVEGDGIMAGTPEVAIKLQEMYPEPAEGLDYDFTKELAKTFRPDAELGAVTSYKGAMASTVCEVKKLWNRYFQAANACIGSDEPMHKSSQNPMANDMNAHFAPQLAELGQFGPSPDGITFAGILPGIHLRCRSSRMLHSV
jgi:hypothetical protein